jgi:hypothetical protein
MNTERPDRGESSESQFAYIELIPGNDICQTLDAQLNEALRFLRTVSEEQSMRRYAPGKWSMREVLSHASDTERAFAFRALWFARGFEIPLNGFDQNVAVPLSGADARSWASHVEEFQAVRAATLTFFRNLPDEAWSRRGVVSGNTFSVRALAFIAAGHVAHHLAILKERY